MWWSSASAGAINKDDFAVAIAIALLASMDSWAALIAINRQPLFEHQPKAQQDLSATSATVLAN